MRFLAGFHDADGSVGSVIQKRGYIYPVVNFFRSNLAFLTAINNLFGGKGTICTRTTDKIINVGKHSKGEPPQVLVFYGEAAREVASQLEPYTVTKAQHIKILLASCDLPAGFFTEKLRLHNELKDLNDDGPTGDYLVVDNIKDEWFAGMYDGDGGVDVNHKAGARSYLRLSITQTKSPGVITKLLGHPHS